MLVTVAAVEDSAAELLVIIVISDAVSNNIELLIMFPSILLVSPLTPNPFP